MIYLEQVSKGALEPVKSTTHAACFDVCADVNQREIKFWESDNAPYENRILCGAVRLAPYERALIPTGWKMQCPVGYRIAVYPRSGLAVKQGISLINCVGIIDADYTDEVFITLVNTSDEPFVIKQGDRIAQLALERVEPCEMKLVDELPTVDSNRVGGFGSTGV